MPYKLRGNSVVKSDSGEVVKSHPSREKALAHLRALKANVEESAGGVLGALLEGFAAPAADPFPEHDFTTGDQVRVSVGGGASSVTGRVMRPHGGPKPTHAVISPEGGGAHVLAPVGQVKLNTPAQHAAAAKRQQREQAKQEQQKAHAAWMAAKPGGPKPPPGGLREGVGVLLEAFAPAETPAQSAALGAQQVAQARQELGPGGKFDPNKHPRAAGGRFGSKGGPTRTRKGRSATRSSSTQGRFLRAGASGALVSQIQQQLRVGRSGTYDEATRQAVLKFQRQLGLMADGIVGRQTLAALRGHSNPRGVTPGPIASSAANVRVHRANRTSRAVKSTAPQPNRLGGGVVV